jgi:hypothetical protein
MPPLLLLLLLALPPPLPLLLLLLLPSSVQQPCKAVYVDNRDPGMSCCCHLLLHGVVAPVD